VLVGLPALRVKGLFLAVTTLAFGFMAGSWMFNRGFWNGGRQSVRSAIRERPELFGVDFGEPRNYYYLCLAFLVATVVDRQPSAPHRRRSEHDRRARQRGHDRRVDGVTDAGKVDGVRRFRWARRAGWLPVRILVAGFQRDR